MRVITRRYATYNRIRELSLDTRIISGYANYQLIHGLSQQDLPVITLIEEVSLPFMRIAAGDLRVIAAVYDGNRRRLFEGNRRRFLTGSEGNHRRICWYSSGYAS